MSAVLDTLDWAAEQVRGRHVCASEAERHSVDAGLRNARATVERLAEAANALAIYTRIRDGMGERDAYPGDHPMVALDAELAAFRGEA